MSNDAYVQVATDGSGKKVSMEQGVDANGNTVYFQRAVIVGDVNDSLAQLVAVNKLQLAATRAMLALLNSTANVAVLEEDFYNVD